VAIVTGGLEMILTLGFLPQVAAFYTNNNEIKHYIYLILGFFVWLYIIDHI